MSNSTIHGGTNGEASFLNVDMPNLWNLSAGSSENVTIQISRNNSYPDVLIVETSFPSIDNSTQSISYCRVSTSSPILCTSTVSPPNIQSTMSTPLVMKVQSLDSGGTLQASKVVTVKASETGTFPFGHAPKSWLIPALVAVIGSSSLLLVIATVRGRRKRARR